MGTLKILASGDSTQAQAQGRGKLFEALMSEVLRNYGYNIDTHHTNIVFAGMEIDIEGKAIVANTPLYAECKCYDSDITCPMVTEFFGKYMARWFKDNRCQGLFIALPGINPNAKGFFRENIDGNSQITLQLFQENDILKAMWDTQTTVNPDVIAQQVTPEHGTPGDWIILYTDKGIFWVQYIIPPESGIPSRIAFFNAKGVPLSDRLTIDYMVTLYPELSDFERITIESNTILPPVVEHGLEQVVEVRGSSECFEYQFPASPTHFVGRQAALDESTSFVTKVLNKETSSRGILFEANSGWGKSSVVLALASRLEQMGHFAIAIDSRSASTSQFILRVVQYTFARFGGLGGLLPQGSVPSKITGFEGAVTTILEVGRELERRGKLLVILLDQFENLFFLEGALTHVRDVFLKVCDSQTNVVWGFSWKTDLIGLTNEFPYRLRDDITCSSKRVALATFSELETNAIIDMLGAELHAPIRKDLRFFLSEFSQGYPWLLKKLCAHVKTQREQGVPQAAIARSLLNVEGLFHEDLRGLSAMEEDTLRRIAKLAPIAVSELGEEFIPGILQSLIDRRLVVRVANKYDIYWDIFRDYLNYGRLPVQENYILRTQVGTLINAIKLLVSTDGTLDVLIFQQKSGLSGNSFYNVAKDMGLLGLAKVDNGKITLQIRLPSTGLQPALRDHLQDRLRRNRLVWGFSEELKKKAVLDIDQMSKLLKEWCPYISATEKTWSTYARIFVGCIDAADLAIWDNRNRVLRRYEPATEIRERDLLLTSRRAAKTVRSLQIQYGPVEDVLRRLIEPITRHEGRVNWSGLTKSAIYKSMATLEDLGYVRRDSHSKSYLVQQKLLDLIVTPGDCKASLKAAVLQMQSFQVFLEILQEHGDVPIYLDEIAAQLRIRLNAEWTRDTARTNAKIMLNWARNTGVAPEVFNKRLRRLTSPAQSDSEIQKPLF